MYLTCTFKAPCLLVFTAFVFIYHVCLSQALTAGLGFGLARLQSSSHLLQVNTGEATFNQGPEQDKRFCDGGARVLRARNL